MHKLIKSATGAIGVYIYRNHRICREETEGPEGGARLYWSVSGDLNGPDANSAHAELPQLRTRKAAVDWVDAYLGGGNYHGVQARNLPRVWGD